MLQQEILLLSHIVRSKLPSFFLQELCRRSNVGFPTVNQFIDLGPEIFKMFKKSNVTSKAKMSYNVSSVRPKLFSIRIQMIRIKLKLRKNL